MKTQIVEATNNDLNWGKFLVAKFDEQEWGHRSTIAPSVHPLLMARGWGSFHRLVLDIETGEGFIISPGGSAHADLQKKAVWVCPLLEPFLEWWYREWPAVDVGTFPAVVQLPDAEFMQFGYRRPGLSQNEAQKPPG